MPQLLICDIDDETMETLRRRAASHDQSVEFEAKTILADALRPGTDPWATVNALREKLERSGSQFPDSTPLIREDRDR